MLIKTPVYNEIEEFIKSKDNYCILNHLNFKNDDIVSSIVLKASSGNGQIMLYSKLMGLNRNVTFNTQESCFVGLKMLCVIDNKYNIVFSSTNKKQVPDILKDSLYENYTLVVGPPGSLIKDNLNLMVSDLVNSNKNELYNEFPNKKVTNVNLREAIKVIKDIGFNTNLMYEFTDGLDNFKYNNDIETILATLDNPALLNKIANEIYETIKPSCVYWLSRADALNNLIQEIIDEKDSYEQEYKEINKHFAIKSAIEMCDKAKTFIVENKVGTQQKVLSFLQNNTFGGSCFRLVNSNVEINILDIQKIIYKNKTIYENNTP